MFDVFYTGPKPNIFPHESPAESVEVAIKESQTHSFWYLNGNNDYSNFDFDWVPDKWEAHQWHIFPDQWSRNSETYFVNRHTLDSDERNYNSSQTLRRTDLSHRVSLKFPPTRWFVPEGVMPESIDFSWHPDPMDPPYIYHFPTKYQRASGVVYTAPGAVDTKYIKPFKVKYCASKDNWLLPEGTDESSIDFTWRPNYLNGPVTYLFASEFHRACGVKYHVEGADRVKMIKPFKVKYLESKDNWVIPKGIDEETINFTWRPDAWDTPYIYKFSSQWAHESGLEYHVPGAIDCKFISGIAISFDPEALPRYYIETTIEDLIAQHEDEVFWALNNEMNYDKFDFSWHPDNSQRNYLHVFGSQWQKHAQTFYVDSTSVSSTDIRFNFVGSQTVRANSCIDIFYVDKSNSGSFARYKALCSSHESVTKIRYAKDIYATAKRASLKSKGSRFWLISSENDYTDFNFDWHAEPWQDYMLHIFGSEEQKWSDTYLINKNVFDDHTRWCKDIKDMPDLHFVEDQKVKAINVNDIYEIDFGQHDTLKTVQHDTLKTTRFVDSYLAVIKRVVAQSTSEYIWMISNICDYSNFNFDWRPEPYQAKMLHVFGTGNNKFGDTFLVHVPSFKKQMDKLELLDWYKTVNYCTEQIVPRLPHDHVPYTGDDLTNVIKSHRFNSPYALFFPEGQDISSIDYNPSVWRLKDRAIHTFTESGSIVLAPRDTLQYLDTQCYDYPEIKRQTAQFLAEKPLDIIFISNGETHAQRNYDHLVNITRDVPNRLVHIKGVKGRAEAYKAAAAASKTDWFFAVFAKLEVDIDFDWAWQIDRLQNPKHYVFYARNPTVGINYGHASIIAYNKQLTLDNKAEGLDFTLDQPHEVVSIHSGITHYDGDIHTAWRTSFRETIKLYKNICDGNFVEVSQERLDKWCSSNGTIEGDWNAKGGQDGVAYYKEVKGDFKLLKLSYDWEWLDNRFRQLHKLK